MNYRYFIHIIIATLLLLLLCTCDETVLRDDCADLDEIELVIKGSFYTECEPNDILPARSAYYKIIKGTDTLFTGNLDENGRFETGPIQNSSCGLNNLKIETSYNGKIIREEFGVLCCDTTLTYLFRNITCEPPVQINCGNIDTTIVKTITSSGDCVMQNATINELKNNVVILYSPTPVRINVEPLNNLNGKIFIYNTIPNITGNNVNLNGNQLELYFDVDKSELGDINQETIELPVYCTDNNGNDISQGTITIKLDASVCDPNDCYCPFGDNDKIEKHYAPENVKIGTSESFKFNILELTQGQLGDGCLLKIESIKRADGSDAYTNNNHAWTIETNNFPNLLAGDNLEITTKFTPPTDEEYTDEFEVFTAIYSEADPNTKKNNSDCSFKFKLIGAGCADVCPSIQILASNVKLRNISTSQETALNYGQKIEFANNISAVKQQLKGKMSTDCLNELKEPGIAYFNIEIPNGHYCGNINLEVEKSQLGPDDEDMERFTPLLLSTKLGDRNNNTMLSITFLPPDLAEHYNSKHSDIFQCAFDVIATDDGGNELCRQKIHIESQVFEFSLGSREVVIMEAFSQKSSSSSIPSYHVFDIDEYNKKLNNYGLREALTANFIDFSNVPNVPVQNDNHSLYFDVDSPENTTTNLTQNPELYLVNAIENNFSRITATPVATFSTHDAFVAAYQSGQLMKSIFNNPLNNGSGSNFEWSATYTRIKESFVNGNGLQIKPFEVYVIWDPSSAPDQFNTSNGGNRNIFCGMALLYVSEVKTGDNNLDPVTGGQGKANVSFYIEYPLKYDE